MSYQDWKVSWTIKNQNNMGISVNDPLNFEGLGSTWSIITPSITWNGVSCIYDQTSDTVSGSNKDGTPFTIVRSVVAPPGKDFITCNIPGTEVGSLMPSSASATSTGLGRSSYKSLSRKKPRSCPQIEEVYDNGPTGGGTWTAEEGSG